MASAVEDFCKFQAESSSSSSVSFGRFESETLSWERKSSFSHNRYLEEVEKYSTPGSVTEKKAYFEAHFKKTALRNLIAIERENKGMEGKDTSIEEMTEDCTEKKVMGTGKEGQMTASTLSPVGSDHKASSLRFDATSSIMNIQKEAEKYVETANGKKTYVSVKSWTAEKARLSSLKRTTKASLMEKSTTEHRSRISKIGGTAGQVENKISPRNVYSSSGSKVAKVSKKIEKETTITVRHSSSRLSTSRNRMKLEESYKTTDKVRMESRSSSKGGKEVDRELVLMSTSYSQKKSSRNGHGSTYRDKQLKTTMKPLTKQCNEGIDQTEEEAKVKSKPTVKQLSIKEPPPPLIFRKPNAKQLTRMKAIPEGRKLLNTVNRRGLTTSRYEHTSVVLDESNNLRGQKLPYVPSRAANSTKRDEERMKSTARKMAQGDRTIKARTSGILRSKGMISQDVALTMEEASAGSEVNGGASAEILPHFW